MKIAIAGGGIYGQVIAWRLALRGHDVTLVEPVGPGNATSGSGDRTRLVRAFYARDCCIESGFRSLELWRRWAVELGVGFHEPCGVLYFDRDRDEAGPLEFRRWIDDATPRVRALGGLIEELDPAAAARRWPGLSPAGLRRIVHEPAGGFVHAALATRAIARAGLATGHVTHVAASVRLARAGLAADEMERGHAFLLRTTPAGRATVSPSA